MTQADDQRDDASMQVALSVSPRPEPTPEEFEATLRKWQAYYEPLRRKAAACEMLTAEDWAVTINATSYWVRGLR